MTPFSRSVFHLAVLTLPLGCLGLAGCVTPASVPDRSSSAIPERTLDRGFSSPGSAPPTSSRQTLGGDPGTLLLPPASVPPGFGGVR